MVNLPCLQQKDFCELEFFKPGRRCLPSRLLLLGAPEDLLGRFSTVLGACIKRAHLGGSTVYHHQEAIEFAKRFLYACELPTELCRWEWSVLLILTVVIHISSSS